MKVNAAFWRWRGLELTIAGMLLVCAIYIFDNLQQRQRAGVPAENWFRVNSIFVPDHANGENPPMTYDRTISEQFQGFWVVEVQRLDHATGGFVPQCSGAGVSDYEPADYIPENIVKMEWFIGKNCDESPPGEYRVRASWTLRRPGWPEKTVVAYSNLYKVYEKN